MNAVKHFFIAILTAVNSGSPTAFLAMLGVTSLTEVGIPTLGIIDAALLYVGYQFGLFSWRALFIILALTGGRLLGSSALFWPSRRMGASFIKWLEKHLPWICSGMNKVSTRLGRHQVLSVVVARFTPGLLTASSVGFGTFRIKFRNFLAGITIHAVAADVILILIGFIGKDSVSLTGFKPQSWQIVVAAFLFIICSSLAVIFFQKRAPKKSPVPQPSIMKLQRNQG